MQSIIFLDIETSLTFAQVKAINDNPAMANPIFATFGDWIAVTSQDGVYELWTKPRATELMTHLTTAPVTGWNILSFDLPIVALTAMNQGAINWQTNIDTIDLFALISRQARRQFGVEVFYKLEDVAQLNFGFGKDNDSARIPSMFVSNHAAVIEHCKRDVGLESWIYLQARAGTSSTQGLKLPAKEATKYAPAIPEWIFTLETNK